MDSNEANAPLIHRRELFKQGRSYALKTLFNVIPLATVLFPEVAQSNVKDALSENLNIILSIEYLQSDFYIAADAAGAINNAHENIKDIFKSIRIQQDAHIKFLTKVLGSAINSKPNFNFSGVDLHTYETFLIYSQAFEELAVRTYKGILTEVIDQKLLNTILRMHSTESRHASIIRIIRGKNSWITNSNEDDTILKDILKLVYKEEAVLKQGGFDFNADVSFNKKFSKESLTEAFDEPMSLADVNFIITQFK